MNRASDEPVAGLLLVVERRIDRRIGECRGEHRENAFGAAALIEIVVDECELQEPLPSLPCTTAMVGWTRYRFATRARSAGVTFAIAAIVFATGSPVPPALR